MAQVVLQEQLAALLQERELVKKTQRELRKKQRLVLKRRKRLVKVAFLLLRAALATSNWAFL